MTREPYQKPYNDICCCNNRQAGKKEHRRKQVKEVRRLWSNSRGREHWRSECWEGGTSPQCPLVLADDLPVALLDQSHTDKHWWWGCLRETVLQGIHLAFKCGSITGLHGATKSNTQEDRMETGPKLLRQNDRGDVSDSVATDNVFLLPKNHKAF